MSGCRSTRKPRNLDYTVENIFSSTDPASLDLQRCRLMVHRCTGMEKIKPRASYIVTADAEAAAEVADTDRWILDLSDRTVGEEVNVAVHVTRHFTDANGNEGPSSI